MAIAELPPPRVMKSADPSAREIIAQARSAPAVMRGALRLNLLTALLLWASFTPLNFSPLAWFALVPLCLLVRLHRPTARMYFSTYLGGLAFWLPALQWMRLGDPSMYVAWCALASYMALYFPLFLFVSRVAVWRWKWPLMAAVPLTWTGLEYLRSTVMSGFGWYQLGHTQYRWLELIQCSDLVGVYGVSSLVALVSACFASVISEKWFQRMGLLPLTPEAAANLLPTPQGRHRQKLIGCCVAICAIVLTYGFVRRYQGDFRAGPRVAAIQGNFVASVRQTDDPVEVYKRHLYLTSRAVKERPDLIVWPEGMVPYPLFWKPAGTTLEQLTHWAPQIPEARWKDQQLQDAIKTLSQQCRAALVLGMNTITADNKGIHTYNSAVFVTPSKGMFDRYDKVHLVPFGEYLPLRDTFSFLQSFSPYGGESGLNHGDRAAVLDYKNVRYAPVICFEDTVPSVVRWVVQAGSDFGPKPRKVDVLLNLTNDGWFHGSSEHDQHLITAAFRCVEFRTPMVRAVNTGISAIIDGDGAIRNRAFNSKTNSSKWTEAVVCDYVPLDNRSSLYLKKGDWYAGSCAAMCCLLFGVGIWRRQPHLQVADRK